MNKNTYITIMAGGVGSRFWPASTEDTPKQFLDILGVGKSLLQMTVERFLAIVPYDRVLIVTNKKYKKLVQEHLPEIPEKNILCEPSRNNTAPCVAYTALRLFAENKDAVFVTAPSDHVILKEGVFLEKIKKGIDFVENNDGIVTLGLEPTRPDTGYGYIEIDRKKDTVDGVHSVAKFREKPNVETAEEYLRSGNYLWNAGIFIWKAEHLIKSFEDNAPDILTVLREDVSKYNTSEEQAYIDRVYPNTPSISVDYAILEKDNNVYTIPAEIGWSDLGTWNSLHAYLDKDENDTVTLGANTYLDSTKNCIVRSDSDKIVVIKGLEDYIVVDEPGALLIYPKSDEQRIKEVVKSLSK
ncbi:mannose-1-phosphate guanylyltransferase [Saprospiraceae bacterium]|nr:mannose-1-phosphate guanylyltransferase [Saprospiraceae bacterium]